MKTLRPIMPGEVTLSASKIAEKILELHGLQVSASKVGSIASRIGLDFLEVPRDIPGVRNAKPGRVYSLHDLDKIVGALRSGNSAHGGEP